jgi:ribosomal protein L19
MGTMPVIEQAKGIVIAQQRCGPDEAFDLLRRISQRTNVKLHVLAAQIVERASSSTHDNVTLISPGITRYLRSRTMDAATRRA